MSQPRRSVRATAPAAVASALLAVAAPVGALAAQQQPPAPTTRADARARLDSLRRAASRDTARIGAVRVVGVRSGTSLRSTGPVAVDRLPVAPIASVGQQEVSQILNFVAPSFYSVTQTQADGADHVDFAALRALGADQTLVLVNGKRRHTSALLHLGDNVGQGTAGVDLNALPAAALARVEVLRDGAAAQYGSDAIAGVLNFVLRSEVDRPRVSLQTGQTTRGDGQSLRADFVGGRTLGAAPDGRRGFAVLTGEVRHREPTQRVGRWNGNVYTGNLFNFGDVGPNGEYATEAEYQRDLQLQRERRFDPFNVQRIGDSRLFNGTLFLNAATPLARTAVVGDSAEVYAFGGATYRQGEATAFFRQPADASQAVLSVFPDGYLPRIGSRIWDGSLALGLRGQRGAWRYDLGTAAGGNRFGYVVGNTLNPSLGASSPTRFDAGALRYLANTVRLDLARPLPGAPRAAGEPRGTVSVGTEWRLESYGVTAGEEGSWRDYGRGAPGAASGSRGFPGFQPRDAGSWTRSNVGAYADAEYNVTGALLLSGAARAERYSDFGGRLTGKLAGLYRLGERAALRAAANTGFRAPSLHQVHASKRSSIFANNREVVSGLFANDDPVARALGVAALRPETSNNLSGGLVLEPVRRLTFQADVYRIDVRDRIVASGVLQRGDVPAVNAALAGFPDVTAVQFFTNAIDTRTDGVDARLSYPVLTRRGVLALDLGANYGTTRIRGPVRTPAGLGSAPLFNPQERSFIENALPNSKWVGSARWQTGSWNALVRGTRFGRADAINLFGPNEVIPAAVIADVSVGRTVGRYDLSIGANNVLDKLPPLQDYANSYFGIFNHSRVAPYGLRGRFVFVNLATRL